ncbi:hypothetical protein QRZ34_27625 [Klebsiella michiganensis]|jgi:hypothetical protein|uniref:Mu transposase domain-containing protein n=1 Tax=Klebsiella michiganensis TaxID=1134687 RepID=UPI0025711632|nr:hypothetical protein [Klebsiella michiganensis]MDL4454801.1 hypothetical protein [Klebsiella michiganensis]
MRLRHEVFPTLADLNLAIGCLLKELNERPFKRLPGCRRILFERLDKPALKALPPYRYESACHGGARLPRPVRHHAYSVPHALVGSHIDIEAGARLIRLYHRGALVAQHPRSGQQGGFTTQAEHTRTGCCITDTALNSKVSRCVNWRKPIRRVKNKSKN